VKYSRKKTFLGSLSSIKNFSLGDIELVRGIQTNLNNGEFILVLRTDGRIVAMSDEVEHHLSKTMVKNSFRIF
jgi:nitrite reductase/ring-hydroxylating ferredoxin subunit